MFSPSRAAAAVIGLSWLLLAGSALAQVVVLESSGPTAADFPAGAMLPASRVLVLKAGDRLRVMDATGVRIINGPRTVAAGEFSPGARATLRALFDEGRTPKPRFAATRSPGHGGSEPALQPLAPGLWQLNVTAGGDFCVVAQPPPSFWRERADPPEQQLMIRGETAETALVWPAGRQTLAWPDQLPLTDRAVYQIQSGDADAAPAKMIRVRRLAAIPPNLAALAKALLNRGCYSQFESLKAGLVGAAKN